MASIAAIEAHFVPATGRHKTAVVRRRQPSVVENQ
jgi:hypothetical protein